MFEIKFLAITLKPDQWSDFDEILQVAISATVVDWFFYLLSVDTILYFANELN